jgi:8-oxo-dGTP diphosphatase
VLLAGKRSPSGILWAPPGGRVEPGESLAEALKREFIEETTLAVAVGRPLGVVEVGTGDERFLIYDFCVTPEESSGELRYVPGDDVDQLRMCDAREVENLALAPGVTSFFRVILRSAITAAEGI